MGDVWDRTVERLGEQLGVLLPVAILGIFVPLSVLNALGALWAVAGMGTKLALTLAFVALYLLVFWAYLAITAVMIDPRRGASAWSAVVRRLPAGIGVYLLLGVIGFVLTMPIGMLAALAGIDMSAMQRGVAVAPSSPALVWVAVAYFLAFLVVVLFATARLMPLTAVIVAERRGAGAIARAWRLTRGLSWRLIGVMLLYVIVLQVSTLAAQTVFGSVLRIFAGGRGPLDVATIVTGIVVAAVQTGFGLLGAAFAAQLYVSVVRTEASAPPINVPDQP